MIGKVLFSVNPSLSLFFKQKTLKAVAADDDLDLPGGYNLVSSMPHLKFRYIILYIPTYFVPHIDTGMNIRDHLNNITCNSMGLAWFFTLNFICTFTWFAL